jgi:putative ABC transport system permease protein
MFRNYLKVTLRNLFRNRVYTLINVLGLGIALSVCIVAYFNYRFDADFDGQHVNGDRIYRVTHTRDIQGRQQEYGSTPSSLARQISNNISGVDKVCRIQRTYTAVKTGNEIFNKNVTYVDPEFLDMFTFQLLAGKTESIHDPNNVLISDELAGILFGKADPVGKPIGIINDQGKEFPFIVAGIFKKLPLNSSFRIDVLAGYTNFLSMFNLKDDDWKLWATATFIMVNVPGMENAILQQLVKYQPIQNQAREDAKITSFRLVPLKEVKRNTREIWNSGLFPGLHPAARIAPPIMALLILLIASFNFTNTSIASSSRRLKEIGIRKVVGGQKRHIIVQFLAENIVVCFLALLVAIGIATFLVPAYSSLWEYMSIKLTFRGHYSFWIYLMLLLMATGILAGAYPAFYVSSFRPVAILQEKLKLGGSNLFTKLLLVLQFAISVLALVSGFAFTKNANYQNTLDLGYDKDMIIAVPVINNSNFIAYRNEVMKNPDILAVAGSEEHIGWGAYVRSLKNEERQLEVDMMDIGMNYIETMGLKIVEGRGFSPDREEADVSNGSILVNQKLVRDFGWQNPIGQRLVMNDTVFYTVTGVVRDFYARGLYDEINPLAMTLSRGAYTRVLVARAESGQLPAIQAFLSQTWKNMFPNNPYEGFFQEETLAEAKSINSSIRKVYVFLAFVATILSLTGLYTLVSLTIINRTKEIGVRKVLGSRISEVMWVLSQQFMVILLFASAIGCPAGFYSCRNLMSSIWEVHTKMTTDTMIYAVLLIVMASMITILGKVFHAASMNPSVSLRYE